MRSKKLVTATMCASVIVLLTGTLCAQKDPGPRAAPVGAGSPIKGLTPDQLRFFNDGAARFNSPDTVSSGLGPAFNGDFCGTCHSQPFEGGSSPSISAYPNVGPNPQVALATAAGAINTVPSFIRANGPVREARFKYKLNTDGTPDTQRPDGGVHDLFTIAGRSDASGCVYPQPNFAQALATNNVIFRIPTPVFGAGLIENIDEATLINNANANAAQKLAFGIIGTFNRSGNDGSITRFGWKAQNKSLLMFAGEAYNVEVGVTNELFPNERGNFTSPTIPAGCLFNSTPEDTSNFLSNAVAGTDDTQVPSDITAFADFMRFLDQPTPSCTGAACSASIQNGNAKFSAVGCALCHTPSLTSGKSTFAPAALSGVQANLFSDLLLHNMGDGLADGISQGLANGNQFRTTPLWGIGQRVYFIHDGRTSDLLQAIELHKSSGSESNRSVDQFNGLSPSDQQDILNFLRSL
jgi:CxxC motif-containing protein (DUF1111 family)